MEPRSFDLRPESGLDARDIGAANTECCAVERRRTPHSQRVSKACLCSPVRGEPHRSPDAIGGASARHEYGDRCVQRCTKRRARCAIDRERANGDPIRTDGAVRLREPRDVCGDEETQLLDRCDGARIERDDAPAREGWFAAGLLSRHQRRCRT